MVFLIKGYVVGVYIVGGCFVSKIVLIVELLMWFPL